jgi:preprotein translocase subunit SecG
MIAFVTVIHLLVCTLLILVVLLQTGKGADLASAFGGAGTQGAIGARSSGNVLSKATTVAAILFMITSLTLTILKSRQESGTVMENMKEQSQPAPGAATVPVEPAGKATASSGSPLPPVEAGGGGPAPSSGGAPSGGTQGKGSSSSSGSPSP